MLCHTVACCVCCAGKVPISRESEVVYTALKPGWATHFYTVSIQKINIGGQKINVDQVSLWQSWLFPQPVLLLWLLVV